MQETPVQFLGQEDSPGEGKGYPLQYAGLENSMDCIVHRVAKSRTGLIDFTSLPRERISRGVYENTQPEDLPWSGEGFLEQRFFLANR